MLRRWIGDGWVGGTQLERDAAADTQWAGGWTGGEGGGGGGWIGRDGNLLLCNCFIFAKSPRRHHRPAVHEPRTPRVSHHHGRSDSITPPRQTPPRLPPRSRVCTDELCERFLAFCFRTQNGALCSGANIILPVRAGGVCVRDISRAFQLLEILIPGFCWVAEPPLPSVPGTGPLRASK